MRLWMCSDAQGGTKKLLRLWLCSFRAKGRKGRGYRWDKEDGEEKKLRRFNASRGGR